MAVVEVVCGMCGDRRAPHVDARGPETAGARRGKRGPASAERGELFPAGVCDACRKGLSAGSRRGPKAPQEGGRT